MTEHQELTEMTEHQELQVIPQVQLLDNGLVLVQMV